VSPDRPLPRARALRPGARVHVVAPAGPVEAARVEAGLVALQARLELDVRVAPQVHARAGYFAGGDALRLAALQAALDDPEADAIWCARGGYGTTRIVGGLASAGARRPKAIVGFSDVTTLLGWAVRERFAAPIHGPVLAQLGELDPHDVDRVVALLRGELPAPLAADAGPAHGHGRVRGPLFVANVEVLRSLIGTPALPDLRGAVLGLEEVGERPYRIDRALTQLLAAGALAGVVGVALGQFVRCGEDDAGPAALEVAMERLAGLGVPVLAGLPFGHAAQRNAALPCGVEAELDVDARLLRVLEPALVPA